MKKCFLAGLAILAPIILTLLLLLLLFNLLTKPFLGTMNGALEMWGLFSSFSPSMRLFISRALVIVLLFISLMLLGFLTQILLVRSFLDSGKKLLKRIPFVKSIYTAAHEVVSSLFHEESTQFSQVVLAPFPYSESLSIALLTNHASEENKHSDPSALLSVFIPASPNPTMGFVLRYPRKSLIFLDMKVEDALASIVSCGVIQPNFHDVTKN